MSTHRRKRLLQTAQQQQQQQAELPPPATQQQPQMQLASSPAQQYAVITTQPATATARFELAPVTDNNNIISHHQPAQFVAGNSTTTYTLQPTQEQQQQHQQQLISTSTPTATITMQPTQYLVVRQHQAPAGATLVTAPRHHYMAIKRANDWGVVGNPVALGKPAGSAVQLQTVYHPAALISAASSLPTAPTGFSAAVPTNNNEMMVTSLLPPATGTATAAPTTAPSTDGLVETMNVEEVNAALVLMSLSGSPHSPAMFAAQQQQRGGQQQQLHRHALTMNAAVVGRTTNNRNIVSSLPDRSGKLLFAFLTVNTSTEKFLNFLLFYTRYVRLQPLIVFNAV